MKEYEFHPFANAFPMMSDQEYAELVADIKANGLREPITRYQDKLLDGRNRHKACRELGIKPGYTDFEGDDEEALAFVISMNIMRRHLTTSQRAMIADDLATLRQGQRKSDASNDASQVETAKQMHVSRPTVQRARKVNQKGTPELAASVRRGEISVSAAASQIAAKAAHGADATVRAATNGHADTGIANDQGDDDPGHTDPGDGAAASNIDIDDGLPVVADTDEQEETVEDVTDGDLDVADKPARHIVINLGEAKSPLSFAFELKDGSLAKYFPHPETIEDALQILMHVETLDEWRAAFPGDELHQLGELREHVKMLFGAVGSGPVKSKAKTKTKTKAKPKSKRKI